MPEELYIIKEYGLERWSDERAIGTMVVSGVDAEVAMLTVTRARELFREFGVRAIPSKTWVLLSEEIRRGNTGAAVLMAAKLPKELPANAKLTLPGSEWAPERLRALTAEILARGQRTDAYAHVRWNEDYYVATLSAANPAVGAAMAMRGEILDAITMRAGRKLLPAFMKAFRAVAAEAPGGVTEAQWKSFESRLTRLTTMPEMNLKAKGMELDRFVKMAYIAGVLPKQALLSALNAATILMCPVQPGPEPLPDNPASPLDEHRLTAAEWGETRERPRIPLPHQAPASLFSRPRLTTDPPDDPRDMPPPPVYGEEVDPDMMYARWTTLEWPPFIRPDRHVLWCHQPIDDADGDRTKLVEPPVGRSLRAKNVLALRHVMGQWADRVSHYWPDEPILQIVPVKDHVWVDMFLLETSDTDELSDFWSNIRSRLEEELKKDSTQEKLEEVIEDGIDELAGNITWMGVNVGEVGVKASKLIASKMIEFASWLVDEVFSTEAFQEVIVCHKTSGEGNRIRSWVTWSTRDRDTGLAEQIQPRMDDLADKSVATKALARRTAEMVAFGLDVPGIYWESESQIPDKHPAEINKIFLLSNAVHGAIYWPTDYSWGGHVFLPVRARNSDAAYCVALRTEVRAVHVATPP